MSGNLSIEDLLARAQIEEVQYKYARGIDRRDWARYSLCSRCLDVASNGSKSKYRRASRFN